MYFKDFLPALFGSAVALLGFVIAPSRLQAAAWQYRSIVSKALALAAVEWLILHILLTLVESNHRAIVMFPFMHRGLVVNGC